jgi:hypothetical protein
MTAKILAAKDDIFKRKGAQIGLTDRPFDLVFPAFAGNPRLFLET